MSHRDGQPLEVPPTEVEHGFAIDDYTVIDALTLNVGEARTYLNWPDPRKKDVDSFQRELDERERKRKRLGGFGFSIDRA